MENQEKLNIGIGDKESETLKPAKVKIEKVEITPVTFGNKTNEKVVFSSKHPDREELINISKAKTLRNDKLQTTGLWFVTDEDGKIAKNSTLASFLKHLGIASLQEAQGKEIDTVADEAGYLVFKAY